MDNSLCVESVHSNLPFDILNEDLVVARALEGIKCTGTRAHSDMVQGMHYYSPRSVLTQRLSRGSSIASYWSESDDVITNDLKDGIEIVSVEEIKDLESEVEWIQKEIEAQACMNDFDKDDRHELLIQLKSEMEAEIEIMKKYGEIEKCINDQLEESLNSLDHSDKDRLQDFFADSGDSTEDLYSIPSHMSLGGESIRGFDDIVVSSCDKDMVPFISEYDHTPSWLKVSEDSIYDLSDEEIDCEMVKLEQEVDWLHSEVNALRMHLTLLEFQTASNLKCFDDNGIQDDHLSEVEIRRMETLSALKEEIAQELACTRQIHLLVKERNVQMENLIKVANQRKDQKLYENGDRPLAGINVSRYADFPVELSMEMVMTMAGIYRRQGTTSKSNAPVSCSGAVDNPKKFSAFSSVLSFGSKSKRSSVGGTIGSKAVSSLLGNGSSNGSANPEYSHAKLFDPYSTHESVPSSVGPYEKFSEILSVHEYKDLRTVEKRALYKYKIYVDQLKNVNPTKLRHEERIAFWVNLYNAINMHVIVAYGIPSDQSKHLMLMEKVSYKIGGMHYNILAMEHGVLRACSSYAPEAGVPYEVRFKPDDPRYPCSLAQPEPLINFALCCGTRSSPALRVFSAHNIHSELKSAAKDYLQAAIGFTKNDRIIVPKIIQMYSRDFADNPFVLLEWIADHLPKLQRTHLLSRLPKRKNTAGRVMQVASYDWTFRYLLP